MKKRILVEGMSCGHCVAHVSEALKAIGAKNVEVNLDRKLAIAEVGENIKDNAIRLAVQDAGYEVVRIENID